jgi:creatinine amidohydrolase
MIPTVSEQMRAGPQSTTFETEKSGCDLAVLGVGSFEQHSHHLPLETDLLIARAVSGEVAARLGAFLLNPLPYSVALCHKGFSGTVYMKPETLMRIIRDLAESVGVWGVRYLAVLNCHGGNFVLNPTIREWNMERRLPHIMLIEAYNAFPDMAPNLHACEVETSLMLHLEPRTVHMDRARDFVPEWKRDDLTHFGMKRISPEGVWGYPGRASREKGKVWFDQLVRFCVERTNLVREEFERWDASK